MLHQKWDDARLDSSLFRVIPLLAPPAVRFALDRAGLVGADGATHCGAFDVAYMACLPNMVVMAPSNEAELINMVATCAAIDDRCACCIVNC